MLQVPVFEDAGAVARLTAVAQSWVGTPFYPHGMFKGIGVSCQTLCAEIYRECGVPIPALPRVSLRTFRATRQSVIEAFANSACIDVLEPVSIHEHERRPGDFLLFFHPNMEHAGVLLDGGRFIHARPADGVTISPLSAFIEYLAKAWRPVCLSH